MNNSVSIAMCVGGGLVLYSGIKGATIASTIQAVLSGNLNVTDTETVQFGTSKASGTSGNANTPTGPVSTTDAVGSNNSMTNGTIIYQFLRANGYTPIGAAGAVAAMWGESEWNPESVGSGGCGLMGWNLPSNLGNGGATNNIGTYGGTCKAAGIGNNSVAEDMSSQLSAILNYVSKNGDSEAVAMMNRASSVTDAANIWGPQVEHFGINDVHATGINQATEIMNNVEGKNSLKVAGK